MQTNRIRILNSDKNKEEDNTSTITHIKLTSTQGASRRGTPGGGWAVRSRASLRSTSVQRWTAAAAASRQTPRRVPTLASFFTRPRHSRPHHLPEIFRVSGFPYSRSGFWWWYTDTGKRDWFGHLLLFK